MDGLAQPGLPRHDADQLDLGAGQVDRGRHDVQQRDGGVLLGHLGHRYPVDEHVVGGRRAPRCGRSRAPSRRCPAGSRSITSVRSPSIARAVATLTVVVVLPTPPFWLATTITRVWTGRGSASPRRWRTRPPGCPRGRGCPGWEPASRAFAGDIVRASRRVLTSPGAARPVARPSSFHVKPRRSVDNRPLPVDPHAHWATPDRWKTASADSSASRVAARSPPSCAPSVPCSSHPPLSSLCSWSRCALDRRRICDDRRRRRRPMARRPCSTRASVPPDRRMAARARSSSSAADAPSWPARGHLDGRGEGTSRPTAPWEPLLGRSRRRTPSRILLRLSRPRRARDGRSRWTAPS